MRISWLYAWLNTDWSCYSQDLRTQLSQERDSVRHLTLQKDLELKELRNRIDKDVSVVI